MVRLKSVVCDRVEMVAMTGSGAQGRYVSRRQSGLPNLLSTLKALAFLIVVSFFAWLLADEVLTARGHNPTRPRAADLSTRRAGTCDGSSQSVSLEPSLEF